VGADDRAERLDELDGRARSCFVRHRRQDVDPLGGIGVRDREPEAVPVIAPRREELRELGDRLLPSTDAAHRLDDAVAYREDRLDVQERPGQRLRLADPAALCRYSSVSTVKTTRLTSLNRATSSSISSSVVRARAGGR
jgi:hypothetical protein